LLLTHFKVLWLTHFEVWLFSSLLFSINYIYSYRQSKITLLELLTKITLYIFIY